MNIKDIENSLEKTNKKFVKIEPEYKEPELKEEPVEPDLPKSSPLLIKTLKFLSVLSAFFALSVSFQLQYLGLPLVLTIIFGVIVLLFIIAVEYGKVYKLREYFSGIKTLETKSISIVTVLISLVLSNYGIYNYLNQEEEKEMVIANSVDKLISDTTNYYNSQIDSIKKLEITEVEPYSTQQELLLEQLNQAKTDRENYENKNMTWNTKLRDFYRETNEKINTISTNISKLKTEFVTYKQKEIKNLENKKEFTIEQIQLENNAVLSEFSNKNTVVIIIFYIISVMIETGIVYLAFKAGITEREKREILNKYHEKLEVVRKYNEQEKEKVFEFNKEEKQKVEEHNQKMEEEKMNYITSKPEWKKYQEYKTILSKIYTNRVKGDAMKVAIFEKYFNNKTKMECRDIYGEFISMGIFSEPKKRVGSTIMVDKDKAFQILGEYFQPYFDQI